MRHGFMQRPGDLGVDRSWLFCAISSDICAYVSPHEFMIVQTRALLDTLSPRAMTVWVYDR